jgi:predicted Zn-dependent protease
MEPTVQRHDPDRSRGPSIVRVRSILVVVSVAVVIAAASFAAARVAAARRFEVELALAREEMGAGLFALAQTRLTQLTVDRPGEPEVAYQLGCCEAARARPDAALGIWARIPPESRWAAPAALGFAQTALALGRITEAEQILRAAMRRPTPELPFLRRMLLIIIGQQGRFDEARRLIESQWQATDPNDTASLADRLAMLREHVGLDFEPFPLKWNLSQLERESTSVVERDQRALAQARAYLATRSGNFTLAKTELLSCLDRWPDDPEVWKSWLDWAMASGQVELARKSLEHVAAGALNEAQTLKVHAWYARESQDPANERRFLTQLIAMDPGQSSALARLAELTSQTGEVREAERLRRKKTELDAAFDRYVRLYREDRYVEHLDELAKLAEQLGRWFEAHAFWELAQLTSVSNAEAKHALARLDSRGLAPARAEGSLADRLASQRAPLSHSRSSLIKSESVGHGVTPVFEDRASHAGLTSFVLDNGQSAIHQLPEMSCGGVGLLDFDRDGFMDIYAVQGGPFPPAPDKACTGDRLFRNRGDGSFDDVTARSNVERFTRGYGHGVSVADYDNDGDQDVFVTRWRSYALYRNNGNGTFDEMTQAAGLGGDRDWPTSSAFADLDNDGDLDLYVCHYGLWDTVNPRICKDPAGAITITCDPRLVSSLPDHVFRNDGGRFVDVTAEAGIIDRDGRGLGVVAADLDGDGLIDLFVANDSTANFLFHNLGGFRFEEVGHSAGVAANAEGGYQAGMGIACGDLDGDGLPDLAVTNFYGESTTFFHNLGHGLFADHGAAIGLAAPSRYFLGFGAAFFDANNDGRLDLLTANGHVSDTRPLFPYAMAPQLYLGDDSGHLAEVTAQAGPPFQQLYVGRGLAVGDIDNDGRLDAIMVAQNEPPVYFHNQTERSSGHFVTFRLEGTKSNRDGVGCSVAIVSPNRRQVRQRMGGGSFQSAADPRLHFGLGRSDHIDAVEVKWPSGQLDRFQDVAVDQNYRLIEGATAPTRIPR